MMPALKSEFRKMFTIRATYVILLVVFLLMAFFAFYVNGWKADMSDLHNPLSFTQDITGAVSAVSVFSALVAILLITQEYRYNLIAYTLTASNNRNKVLAAKVILCTVFGIIFTLIVGFASPVISAWGAHLHGHQFSPQLLDHGKLLWECLFYGWGYTMAGLLFGTLIRNQIGAIIVLFIAPSTVEALLGLLLKNNSVYLPFTALSVVLGQTMRTSLATTISPARAALVFSAYLVVSWAVAWVLFLRRDAMS